MIVPPCAHQQPHLGADPPHVLEKHALDLAGLAFQVDAEVGRIVDLVGTPLATEGKDVSAESMVARETDLGRCGLGTGEVKERIIRVGEVESAVHCRRGELDIPGIAEVEVERNRHKGLVAVLAAFGRRAARGREGDAGLGLEVLDHDPEPASALSPAPSGGDEELPAFEVGVVELAVALAVEAGGVEVEGLAAPADVRLETLPAVRTALAEETSVETAPGAGRDEVDHPSHGISAP